MLSATHRFRGRPVAGWALRRLRELADPLAVAVAARGAGAVRLAGPVPPRRLRARTGAPGIQEFSDGGRRAARELSAVLVDAGLPALAQYASVLDFGCGSARVLPHVLALAPAARCTGADVDPAAIAWATRAHPALTFAHSEATPPLPFPAASFALVYSVSVFSHLDEPLQDRWLAELARVLDAGGIALLTVHGSYAFEQFRSGAVRTGWAAPEAFARGPLQADELVFIPYARSVWNAGELPGVSPEYGLTFHGADYLRARFSEHFEIVTIAPHAIAAWQDVVICRKR
jgi:SAM-dependent methyltransferase